MVVYGVKFDFDQCAIWIIFPKSGHIYSLLTRIKNRQRCQSDLIDSWSYSDPIPKTSLL